MSGLQCNKCGSTNIDTDSPSSTVVCIACGNVLEDSGIVSEVQYVQDSRGASRAVGQLVSYEDGGYGLGNRFGSGRESRAITLQNAKHNIQTLASKLQLKPHAVDTALNYYKLALTKHLTKGRKSTHVVAACVYMVCRKDGTSHMLLDLSDVLKINVYELGKTYLKLSSELRINTPAIDPILYIARFAHQLQFGDKENEVALTATKLVRRMKSDWIHFGRRPSGLCGAALLVAARLHNFNRTIDDIIKVVKVCQATVRKRLNEFGDTPSGKLSIEDFMTVDLSEEQDPPSFKNARKKIRELDDDNKVKDLETQVMEFRKQIEKALDSTKKKSFYSKFADDEGESSAVSSCSESRVDMIIAENTLDSIKDVIGQDTDSCQSVVDNLVPLLAQESESVADGVEYCEQNSTCQGLEPSLESLGLRKTGHTSTKVPETITGETDDKLDITDLDDEELDRYFMKPCEYKKKDEFWHKFNADYLEELKEREERRALEEEENAKKPPKKKRNVKNRGRIQANTPGEAMSKVFQQKKISHKLNYDILKSLNPECTLTELEETPNLDFVKSEASSVKSVRVRPRPKPAYNPVPLNIKKGMSDIVGSNRRRVLAALAEDQAASQEPPEKKLKISDMGTIEPLEEAEVIEPLAEEEATIEPEESAEVELEEDEEEDSEDEYGFPKHDRPPDYDMYEDDYVSDNE